MIVKYEVKHVKGSHSCDVRAFKKVRLALSATLSKALGAKNHLGLLGGQGLRPLAALETSIDINGLTWDGAASD